MSHRTAAFIALIGGGILLMARAGLGATGGGGKLSAAQIAQLAANAGFTGDDIVTATAIALAESGGDPNAEGDLQLGGGNDSIGLWQIDLKYHKEFTREQLFDPQTNANEAYKSFLEGGFREWSTFDPRDGSTPRYLAFLDIASSGVNA